MWGHTVDLLCFDPEVLNMGIQSLVALGVFSLRKEMDRKGAMSKEIVDALFEQGLMGIEVRRQKEMSGGRGRPPTNRGGSMKSGMGGFWGRMSAADVRRFASFSMLWLCRKQCVVRHSSPTKGWSGQGWSFVHLLQSQTSWHLSIFLTSPKIRCSCFPHTTGPPSAVYRTRVQRVQRARSARGAVGVWRRRAGLHRGVLGHRRGGQGGSSRLCPDGPGGWVAGW